jgi:hypothetical protein
LLMFRRIESVLRCFTHNKEDNRFA